MINTFNFVLKGVIVLVKVLLIVVWNTLTFWFPTGLFKAPKAQDLNAELVLITGAGSGLGRSLAITFAKLGSSLVLWDINEESVRAVADEVANYGSHAYPYLCDCSDREAVFQMAEKVKKEVGNISVIVNNAGIVAGKSIMEIDPTKFEKVLTVNTIAHYWIVKAFLPWMLENNYGYILNIASVAAYKGTAKAAAYCASKAAALSFSDSLRTELLVMKKSGIHVTCVCPGWINTGMFKGIRFPFGPHSPDYVANKAVDALLRNQFIAVVPGYFYYIMLLQSILPTKAVDILGEFLGTNRAMDTFVGNQKSE